MANPILTDAGRSYLAERDASNAPVQLTEFRLGNPVVGGATPADPDPAMTAQTDVVWTGAPTAEGTLNDDSVVYSLLLGTNVGDFDVTQIGLWSDTEVLVYVANIPTYHKRASGAGGALGNNFVFNANLVYAGIASLAGMQAAAETWQQDFTALLALKEDKAEKGAAGGYPPLDGAGLLPSVHVPEIDDAQHGARGRGSLHTVATPAEAGFMAAGDKAKLDGIEAGATADRSAAEILAALKTVDGEGSGLAADTVDGVHASQIPFGGADSATTAINDLDTITKSGFYNCGDGAVGAPGSGHYHVFHNQHQNGGWALQLAIAFPYAGSSGQWMRRKTAGSWGPWQKLWTDDNDGAGSGLDADTVDGLHASALAAAVHAHEAADVTSGTLAAARIPNLDAAKIASGTLGLARIPTLDDARHGDRGGGSLHAAAVADGAAGFMTGADKAKLDDQPYLHPSITISAGVTIVEFDLAIWSQASGRIVGRAIYPQTTTSNGLHIQFYNPTDGWVTAGYDTASSGLASGGATYPVYSSNNAGARLTAGTDTSAVWTDGAFSFSLRYGMAGNMFGNRVTLSGVGAQSGGGYIIYVIFAGKTPLMNNTPSKVRFLWGTGSPAFGGGYITGYSH